MNCLRIAIVLLCLSVVSPSRVSIAAAKPPMIYGTLVSRDVADGILKIKTSGATKSIYFDGNTFWRQEVRTSDRVRVIVERTADGRLRAIGIDRAPRDDAFVAADKELIGNRFRDIIITGVGRTEDQARLNAYKSAMEQTVGLLVDTNTLIENESVIRDEVLTFTKAELLSFQVLRQWDEAGLVHVEAKATVPLDLLRERLAPHVATVSEVDGEFFHHEAKVKGLAEEHVCNLLADLLKSYRPDRLLVPKILGKPNNVGQDKYFVRMSVQVSTVPNVAAWEAFGTSLHRLLSRVPQPKGSQFDVRSSGDALRSDGYFDLAWSADASARMDKVDGAAWGYWVLALKTVAERSEPDKIDSLWGVYRITKNMSQEFDKKLGQHFQIRAMLLDSGGEVLGETVEEVHFENKRASSMLRIKAKNKRSEYGVAPAAMAGHEDWFYAPRLEFKSLEIDVPLEDVKRISHAAARIEPIPGYPWP